MSEAQQTPLSDLLRGIPLDARLSYKHSPTDYQMIPVGRLAASAVTELDRLRAESEATRALLREVAERLKRCATTGDWGAIDRIEAMLTAASAAADGCEDGPAHAETGRS